MSLPDSTSEEPRGVLVRKPQTDIYTVLLGIALGALVLGCLLLLREWARYDFRFRPPPELRSSSSAVVVNNSVHV